MFQRYAVAYKLTDHDKEFGTTVTVDLDEAQELGFEEMGDARRFLIRQSIASRRWGRPGLEYMVFLNEVARLGEPTQTP
jgi:hypothetical protein